MGKPSGTKLMEVMSSQMNVDEEEDDDSIIESDVEPQLKLVEPSNKGGAKRTVKQTRAPRKRVAKAKLDPNAERVFPATSHEESLLYRNKIGKLFNFYAQIIYYFKAILV